VPAKLFPMKPDMILRDGRDKSKDDGFDGGIRQSWVMSTFSPCSVLPLGPGIGQRSLREKTWINPI